MAAEYRFRIEAFTPETMPMARLADYLGKLSQMLGERERVHFVALESGSTVIVHRVDAEALPNVRARAVSIAQGDAPADVMSAYRSLNKLLREDNATGKLQDDIGGELVRFPGREQQDTRVKGLGQHGRIDGEVVRVGGTDDQGVPVMLRVDGRAISGCWAKKPIAKALAAHLFEPVRLHGRGRWERTDEGVWILERFVVESFEPLHEEPLASLLTTIRSFGGEWGEDAFNELHALRHSAPETSHGGA